MSRPRLVVVCGPTATGKTDVGIALARRLNGEIVNADSRQVYRGMDIGTAKPTPAQRAAAPHHLLDIADPDEPFNLATYLDRARRAVEDIYARGRRPIVVGGTGLYIRALAHGFSVPAVPPDPRLRSELEALAARGGTAALLSRLHRSDPARAAAVDARNPRRLMRAIEVAESAPPAGTESPGPRYDAHVIGLRSDNAALYRRADRRVEAMMAAGFLDEVVALRECGYPSDAPALTGLGYRELGAFLAGETTFEEAVRKTMFATHRYIRRQVTWFRREPGLRWIDIQDVGVAERIQRELMESDHESSVQCVG